MAQAFGPSASRMSASRRSPRPAKATTVSSSWLGAKGGGGGLTGGGGRYTHPRDVGPPAARQRDTTKSIAGRKAKSSTSTGASRACSRTIFRYTSIPPTLRHRRAPFASYDEAMTLGSDETSTQNQATGTSSAWASEAGHGPGSSLGTKPGASCTSSRQVVAGCGRSHAV
jgi:hypothetical protein